MVKCSKCKRRISSGTRYYKGPRGGKYHIACGYDIKNKYYAYTR